MARRRRDDEDFNEDAYAAAYFARERPRLDAAMRVLGLLQQRESAAAAQALEERQQRALEAHQAGLLGVQEKQLGISESEAKASAAERAAAEKYRQEERARTVETGAEAKRLEAEKERRELEEKGRTRKAALFEKLVEHGALKPGTPEYQKAMANLDPEYAVMQREIASEADKARFAEALARYRGMTPEQRRAISKAPGELGGPDIYQRILAEMGPEGAPPPPALGVTGGGGPLGAVMNIPTVLRNIGRYPLNVGANIMRSLGVETGTWPYEEFVDPRQFREAQMVLGQLGEEPVIGPAPAVTPRPQFGNYGPIGPPPIEPPWMYGVGTRR